MMIKHRYIIFSLFILPVALFLWPSKANAATNRMPDPDYFSPGQDVNLLVASDNQSTYQLDAAISTIRLFVKNRTGNVRVYHGGHCTHHLHFDTESSNLLQTHYQIYPTDVNEERIYETAVVGGSGLFGAYRDTQLGCGQWSNIPYDLGNVSQSNIHPGFYVIDFQAVLVDNANIGGWNSFKVEVGAGEYASYYQNSSEKFALKAAGTGIPGSRGDYRLPFAPDCRWSDSNPEGGKVLLEWFDPDAGQQNQNYESPVRTVLREYNQATNALISQQVINITQGNNISGSAEVFIRPGSKYVWTWEGIYSANGIQFRLPFDSANYFFNCNPEGWLDSASCSNLTGWAKDNTNPNRTVNIRVYQVTDLMTGPNRRRLVVGPQGQTEFPANNQRGDVGPHGFTIDISAYRDVYSHRYEVYAVSSSGQEIQLSGSPKAVSGCATPQCGGYEVNPLSPEPGENFKVVTRPALSGEYGVSGRARPLRYFIRLNISSDPGGANTMLEGGVKQSPNALFPHEDFDPYREFSDLAITSTGRYYVRYRIFVLVPETNGPEIRNFECTEDGNNILDISNKPYHKVYGGDVLAGMSATGSDGACNVNESAFIRGRNNGGSSSYSGAGAQLAVFALGEITGFASAQFRNVPKGLSFANLPEAVEYGGNLEQAALSCGPNYWSTDQNVLRGNQTIEARTLDAGQQRNIYVIGDVYISGDIKYANVDYGNIDSIPQFRLIVKGNIYVAPSVNQLNGLYVAMKSSRSSNDGKFYTCGRQYAPPNNSEMLVNECNNKLTVYGAVVADQIKFSRTPGTVGNATTNENYQAGGDPAEVFIYTPELWLRSGSGGRGGAASFSTLPPVL